MTNSPTFQLDGAWWFVSEWTPAEESKSGEDEGDELYGPFDTEEAAIQAYYAGDY